MIKFLTYFNSIVIIVLVIGFSWLLYTQKTNNVIGISDNNFQQSLNKSASFDCTDDCKKAISDEVARILSKQDTKSRAVATPTPQPRVVATPMSAKQMTYIPLNGPVTTTSTSWYDLPGTDFNLDINNSYGKDAGASWEAFLKVAHGNGTGYARLFDVTHGIAVNGSEISVTNNPNLTQVASGSLSFWAGNNQYRVQLKSLNSFEVTFASGRLKITY
jgi:hypothetical protein